MRIVLQRWGKVHLMARRVFFLFIVCCVILGNAEGRPEEQNAISVTGLGSKPQMGWSSWNHFGCNVNETVIKQIADALVSNGLAALGYVYVNVDDCWAANDRDSQGDLQANPSTFPSGMKSLVDYVHSKGLKLGIFGDAGFFTCSHRPGSLYHEVQDAKKFAAWGVDYLKYTSCYPDGNTSDVRFKTMHDALVASGRPIFYSVCEWGASNPALWAPKIANSWRTTLDIGDTWESVTANADTNDKWAAYASPGSWNDPDMLEVGNGNMTIEEYKTHFNIWALMKAPLLLGSDLRNLQKPYLQILTNKEVIGVNQDALGVQGKKMTSQYLLEVWAGPLSGGRVAVVLWNRSKYAAQVVAHWQDIGLKSGTVVTIRDLWLHRALDGTYTDSYGAYLNVHQSKMVILTPV